MPKNLVLLPHGERMFALRKIVPGQWVAIAPFHDPIINTYTRSEYSDMQAAINLARAIEQERRLMIFHARTSGYYIQLVARGVDPVVYMRLVDALARIKMPELTLPLLAL